MGDEIVGEESRGLKGQGKARKHRYDDNRDRERVSGHSPEFKEWRGPRVGVAGCSSPVEAVGVYF